MQKVITLIVITLALDRLKPVALESFRDHVSSKHDERDKGFETEYQVMNVIISDHTP